MPLPTMRDVHVDEPLSSISIAYKPTGFIAGEIFPQIGVPKKSDKYYEFDRDYWFRNLVQLRAEASDYPEGGYRVSSTAFECLGYHLAFPLPEETVANQDEVLDMEKDGAEWLALQFALNREIKCAAVAFATSAWTGGSDTSITGTSQWSDYANSDPIGDITGAKQTIEAATGQIPNRLVIGGEVWDKLREHPDFIDKFKYTATGILKPEQVAQALDIEKIVIGRAGYNSAAEKAVGTSSWTASRIWGKSALVMYVPSSPGKRTPAAGYCFVWDQMGGLTTTIKKISVPTRDMDRLQAKNFFIHKMVGTYLGNLMTTVVA